MTKVCLELLNNEKMIIELYEEVAPLTVKNFLDLVDAKFFDGTIFHRVIKNFMCQGGGYKIENKSLKECNAKTIKGEFNANGFKNDLKHGLGVISMARTNEFNSASSQFFLCVDNVSHLDNLYAGFGKISDEESIKVLKKLNNIKTGRLGYFNDFPDADVKDFTIKTIYRI